MKQQFDGMSDQEFMVAYLINDHYLAYGEGPVYEAAYRESYDFGDEANFRFTTEQLDALAQWAVANHASSEDMILMAREDYDKISYIMTVGA